MAGFIYTRYVINSVCCAIRGKMVESDNNKGCSKNVNDLYTYLLNPYMKARKTEEHGDALCNNGMEIFNKGQHYESFEVYEQARTKYKESIGHYDQTLLASNKVKGCNHLLKNIEQDKERVVAKEKLHMMPSILWFLSPKNVLMQRADFARYIFVNY